MYFFLVPWMSGLVNGLQNRLRRFESARHLTEKFGNLDKQRVSGFLFCKDWRICSAFVAHNKKAGDKLQLETPASITQ